MPQGFTQEELLQIPFGRIEELYPQYTSEELANMTCTICLDGFKLEDVIFNIKCKHFFHKECLTKWLKLQKLCPNCKKQITLGNEDNANNNENNEN